MDSGGKRTSKLFTCEAVFASLEMARASVWEMTRTRLKVRVFLITLALGMFLSGVAWRIELWWNGVPVDLPETESGTLIVMPQSERNPIPRGGGGGGGYRYEDESRFELSPRALRSKKRQSK